MGRNFFYFSAICLTLLIGWGSLATIEDSVPKDIHVSDKLVHLSAYFLLTLTWMFVFRKRISEMKNSLLIPGLVFLYGIIIEVLQGSCTDNRQFELKDLLANFIGVVIAFLVFNYFSRKKVFN